MSNVLNTEEAYAQQLYLTAHAILITEIMTSTPLKNTGQFHQEETASPRKKPSPPEAKARFCRQFGGQNVFFTIVAKTANFVQRGEGQTINSMPSIAYSVELEINSTQGKRKRKPSISTQNSLEKLIEALMPHISPAITSSRT